MHVRATIPNVPSCWKVFRSAWAPAPPVASEPAIVRVTGGAVRPAVSSPSFVVLLPVDVVEGGEAVLVICWTWLVSGSIKAFDALALRVASPLVSMALNSATLAARGLLRDIGV